MEKQQVLIIKFKEGIYGFEQFKEFRFFKAEEKSPVSIMQAVADESISFLVIPPTFIKADYELELAEVDVKSLEIADKQDVIVLAILNIAEDSQKISINLKSPIVFSLQSKFGKQIILEKSDYQTRQIIELG